MAEETKPDKPANVYKWIMARDGSVHELYSNYAHISWTLFDVRVRLGKLIPSEAEKEKFVVEEQAAVTCSWHQAKHLRNMLTQLIDSFEKVNGEIKPLKLPPDPTTESTEATKPEKE